MIIVSAEVKLSHFREIFHCLFKVRYQFKMGRIITGSDSGIYFNFFLLDHKLCDNILRQRGGETQFFFGLEFSANHDLSSVKSIV